jgi:alpha-1,6-mannosyl-glycoprotein beta-1,2-N-acetylglucosaminyltransferase
MRVLAFHNERQQQGIDDLLKSLNELKSTNYKLAIRAEELEESMGNLWNTNNKTKQQYEDIIADMKKKINTTPSVRPSGDTKCADTERKSSLPSVDTGNKQDVITHYDGLVYIQKYFNAHGEILNKEKFTLAPDFIPIVIRVFDKHEYVKFTVDHYRNVVGINETMIVFSHDGIFPEVFKVVESIDFCQVKQIVHPYSLHTLTNRFPGKDETIPKHLDAYGHERPYPHTALKHHYWWHLNTAWDVLFPTHTGDIVLMEEDHAPTKDFYVTLKNLARIRDKECPEDCFNVQLHEHGNYAGMNAQGGVHDLVKSGMFGNIGISFNRRNFLKIKRNAKAFCEFDDYNWDWSTIHMQSLGLLPKLSLVPVIPRAVHIGTCGTHFQGDCRIPDSEIQKIGRYNDAISQNNGAVWDKYNIRDGHHLFKGQNTGYGGWAHPYDHEHCMAQVRPNPNFPNDEM